MNTSEIRTALRARFALPEYALMFEVRSGTGHSNQVRYADAIALGMWPSRGLDLIGFEIKASRSDWLRELKEPHKADRIGSFCDRWYVVAGAKEIVLPGELPTGWGLMVPRGDALVVSKEAPPQSDPKPMSRAFLASLLRAACVQSPGEEIIAQRVSEALSAQATQLKVTREQQARHDAFDLTVLRQAVEDFERASGVSIRWRGKKVGEAVRFILEGGLEGVGQRLRSVARTATEIAELARASADYVDLHPRDGVAAQEPA